MLAAELMVGVDPVAVGADRWCGWARTAAAGRWLLLLIGDLPWVDRLSARALLFAVRRC